jgi:hypothetical protein
MHVIPCSVLRHVFSPLNCPVRFRPLRNFPGNATYSNIDAIFDARQLTIENVITQLIASQGLTEIATEEEKSCWLEVIRSPDKYRETSGNNPLRKDDRPPTQGNRWRSPHVKAPSNAEFAQAGKLLYGGKHALRRQAREALK